MENKKIQLEIKKLKSELDELRSKKENSRIKLKNFFKFSMALSLTTGSLFALANLAKLHVFSPGDTISAQKINENFTFLENKIASLGGGSSGGGVFKVNASSTINLDVSHHNQFIVVHNKAGVDINLPDISTVPPGYTIQLKQLAGASFIIHPFGSNLIDQDPYALYMMNVPQADPTKLGHAVLTLISDGLEWSSLLTIGSINRVDMASVATSCHNGEGAGGSNCYDDTNAQSSGYARINSHLFKWQGNVWQQASEPALKLINDQTQNLSAVYTSSHIFALAAANIGFDSNSIAYVKTVGGYYLGDLYSGTSHSNSTDINLLNTLIANYMHPGAHCGDWGENWYHPTLVELQNGGVIPDSGTFFWSATPDSATSDSWWVIDSSGAAQSAYPYSNNKVICYNSSSL